VRTDLTEKIKADPDQAAELLEAVLYSYKADDKTINEGVVKAVRNFVGKKSMRLFIVTFSHEYGTDAWLVRSHKKPTIEQVVKRFDVDFEEEKNESIGIDDVGPIEEM